MTQGRFASGTVSFRMQCATHKTAVEAINILPATTNFKDVGELLSSVHASEKAMNRQCLYTIVTCIRIVDYNFRV